MTYSISDHDSIKILQVESLLNEYDNRTLLMEIQQWIERGFAHFVIDLSLMEYMNSVGLNFLISIRSKSLQSGGRLVIANASKQILNLLEITKLRPMFQLSPTVENALSLFKLKNNS